MILRVADVHTVGAYIVRVQKTGKRYTAQVLKPVRPPGGLPTLLHTESAASAEAALAVAKHWIEIRETWGTGANNG